MRALLAVALLALSLLPARAETILLAGGCFWCIEHDLAKVPGVTDVVSGYAGGTVDNPTYKQVGAGGTGHREVVQVTFDPARIGYRELLDVFWRNIDPFDGRGQFCDKGEEYRAAIFASGARAAEAKASRAAVAKKLGRKVVTDVLPEARFWPAEDYHQDYAAKNPGKYGYYRLACGRDERLAEIWGAGG